jgi:hypothetical protein
MRKVLQDSEIQLRDSSAQARIGWDSLREDGLLYPLLESAGGGAKAIPLKYESLKSEN